MPCPTVPPLHNRAQITTYNTQRHHIQATHCTHYSSPHPCFSYFIYLTLKPRTLCIVCVILRGVKSDLFIIVII